MIWWKSFFFFFLTLWYLSSSHRICIMCDYKCTYDLIVADLRPTRAYIGRAGTEDQLGLVGIIRNLLNQNNYFFSLFFCNQSFLKLSRNSELPVFFFSHFLVWSWRSFALRTSTLLSSSPLSLFLRCSSAPFGLVFPPLPVFASGGWEERKGGEGRRLLQGAPLGCPLPAALKQTAERVGGVCEKVLGVLEYECKLFFKFYLILFFNFGLTNPHASRWFLS